MNHNHTHNTTANIRFAFFLNLAFTIIEIVGGFYTNSLAILSDSLHDLGDSFSLGLSWYLERYSERGKDDRFSYGYRRFSLLGAFVNTVVLIVGSLIILSAAIPRILDPQPTNARGMILLAIVGIAINGLAVLRMRNEQSMNARIVAWHLLEDVLGWIAVLIVSIALLFTNYYILDPLLAILVTVYVLYNVFRNLRKTVALFLQAVPDDIDIDEIDRGLVSIDLVLSTHHTHIWSLDGAHHVLTSHVVLDECATRDDIARVKNHIKELADIWHFEHTTVEIEFRDEDCSMAV
jgi:cobalt-zinc-cadmium efflux system protein